MESMERGHVVALARRTFMSVVCGCCVLFLVIGLLAERSPGSNPESPSPGERSTLQARRNEVPLERPRNQHAAIVFTPSAEGRSAAVRPAAALTTTALIPDVCVCALRSETAGTDLASALCQASARVQATGDLAREATPPMDFRQDFLDMTAASSGRAGQRCH